MHVFYWTNKLPHQQSWECSKKRRYRILILRWKIPACYIALEARNFPHLVESFNKCMWFRMFQKKMLMLEENNTMQPSARSVNKVYIWFWMKKFSELFFFLFLFNPLWFGERQTENLLGPISSHDYAGCHRKSEIFLSTV